MFYKQQYPTTITCVVCHNAFSACEKPNVEIVDHLLKYGASVHKACVQGVTPLHEAAGHANVEICQMLLEAGAKLNAVNNYRMEPFYMATQNGGLDVLHFLIRKGESFSNFHMPVSR
jgi:ankyrin repeat protein